MPQDSHRFRNINRSWYFWDFNAGRWKYHLYIDTTQSYKRKCFYIVYLFSVHQNWIFKKKARHFLLHPLDIFKISSTEEQLFFLQEHVETSQMQDTKKILHDCLQVHSHIPQKYRPAAEHNPKKVKFSLYHTFSLFIKIDIWKRARHFLLLPLNSRL